MSQLGRVQSYRPSLPASVCQRKQISANVGPWHRASSVGAAGIGASVVLAMGDGARRCDPRQGRWHADHAGRGHRRGLDGPSMPNPLSKPGSISLRQPTKPPSDRSGGGRCAGEHATWAGTRDGWFRDPKRGPDTARGQHIEESPLNPAVQAGFRWPLSRSNAPRPTCRSRHAGKREAHTHPSVHTRIQARAPASEHEANQT